ncbi:MAG: tripartite tricarboxylate transporter TctB family protein [Nitrospinota bacterium]
MQKDKLKSLWEAAAWLGFGAAGMAMTFGFAGPLPTFELGAAFWPQIVLGGIMATAVILGITTYFSGPASETVDKGTQTTDLPDDMAAMSVTRKTIAIFAIPLVYVFAMHKLGFFLVTPIFLPLYMYLLGVRKVRTLISVTVGLYAAVLFLFVKLVFTPLPQGAGFFHSLNGQFIGLFQ